MSEDAAIHGGSEDTSSDTEAALRRKIERLELENAALQAAITNRSLDEADKLHDERPGRPVRPHRSGGGHVVGPTPPIGDKQ